MLSVECSVMHLHRIALEFSSNFLPIGWKIEFRKSLGHELEEAELAQFSVSTLTHQCCPTLTSMYIDFPIIH